jgi:predicted dehydrogenase
MTAIEGVAVAAVSGRRRDSAEALASAFGARAFADPVEMLETVRPDALFIAVIPSAHGEIERAAIAREVPFFVEKPLALDWGTAAAIGAEVAAANLVTAVGYQWRHAASVERARELLADRAPAMAQGYWLTRTPAPPWWSRQADSGGQMLEQTTHMFDLARLFLGEAETVYAAGARVDRSSHPDSDIDEVSVATVRFRSGAVASFASTCILEASHKVGLHLYAAGLALEIGAASLIVDDGAERRELRLGGDATEAIDRAFLEAVRRRDPTLVRSSYADALRTHRLTTLARESARTHQVLTVS